MGGEKRAAVSCRVSCLPSTKTQRIWVCPCTFLVGNLSFGLLSNIAILSPKMSTGVSALQRLAKDAAIKQNYTANREQLLRRK